MSVMDKYRDLSVVVGVPSINMIHIRSALCLQALMNYVLVKKIGDFRSQKARLCNTRGSILANLRVDIVRAAFKYDASHILWLDSDQTYPKETLHWLLRRDVDVVAANVTTKSIPAMPTARKKSTAAAPNSGDPVYTDDKSAEMEKVWRVGTGVMLVRTKVYEKIGLNVFGQPWREDWQKYQGEDWTMCEAMEAAGFDIWVDHRLSVQVGHLGEFEYTHNVVGEVVQEPVLEEVASVGDS